MFRFIFLVLIFLLIYSIISSLFKLFFGKKSFNDNKNDPTVVKDGQSHEKIFKKSEGEYVDFEEVKDDSETENTENNLTS
ncbi:conserved hypothetical protein [uncultured Paludibacter sp.]|uniref:DUF4834 domain-containing protein n=1 Tax=uncultured Paludibacter sp. TaxID=497635 RepID=A0A653AH69_9BACT|nr:conserved hypothetical protein [uncultured Paludibacter sp.]